MECSNSTPDRERAKVGASRKLQRHQNRGPTDVWRPAVRIIIDEPPRAVHGRFNASSRSGVNARRRAYPQRSLSIDLPSLLNARQHHGGDLLGSKQLLHRFFGLTWPASRSVLTWASTLSVCRAASCRWPVISSNAAKFGHFVCPGGLGWAGLRRSSEAAGAAAGASRPPRPSWRSVGVLRATAFRRANLIGS